MADTPKQNPFGINAIGSLSANVGFYIQPAAEQFMGKCQYTDNADAQLPSIINDYQPGTLVKDTVLKWPTYAINDAYRRGVAGQANPVLPGSLGPTTGSVGVSGSVPETGASGAPGFTKKVRFTVTAATSAVDTMTFSGPNQFTFSTSKPGIYYQNVWIGYDYQIYVHSSASNYQYEVLSNADRTIQVEDSGKQSGDYNDMVVTVGSGKFRYTTSGYRAPIAYKYDGTTDEGSVALSSSLTQTVVLQDSGLYIFSVFIKSGNVDLAPVGVLGATGARLIHATGATGATGIWPTDVAKIYYLYYEDPYINGILYFNLEDKTWIGVKGSQQDALNPLFVEVTDGWYRISITTKAEAGTRNFVMGVCNNYQIETVDLTISSNKRGFFWGAQVESGAMRTDKTGYAPSGFNITQPRRNLLTNPKFLQLWENNYLYVWAVSPRDCPTGGTTIYRLQQVDNGKPNLHEIYESNIAVEKGKTYTFSVYFNSNVIEEPGNSTLAGIMILDGAKKRSATAEFAGGTIASANVTSARIIQQSGSPWKRLVITATLDSSTVSTYIYIPRGGLGPYANPDGSLYYGAQYGRHYASMYACSAQFELGAVATEFQDTQDFVNPDPNKKTVNLLTSPTIFYQNAWVKDFCYVTANAIASPSGATADNYSTTSSTSLTISTGVKNFTVGTNLAWVVDQAILLTHDANNYMSGTVTGYVSTTGAMTANVTSTTGSGTYTSWDVGIPGYTGTTSVADLSRADMITTGYTVGAQTYNNLVHIGKDTIPALGNSPPETWNLNDPSTDPSGVWKNEHTNWYDNTQAGPPANTGYSFYNWYDSYIEDLDAKYRKNRAYTTEGQLASWWPWLCATDDLTKNVPNRNITMWGWLRAFPLQAWNEFNFNGQSQIGPLDYSNFCYSFSTVDGFQSYNNSAIIPIAESLTFLKGTFSNQNDLMSADVLGVSLASREFGQDLINLGNALDLSLIKTFGLPSSLLQTLFKFNALTSSLAGALLTIGLNQNEITDIASGNVTANKYQEQQIYSAMLIITGPDLAEILLTVNCNTKGLEILADLLNVQKMFPLSYTTLTVPIYTPENANSKTYYPLYKDGGINADLKSPPIQKIVSTITPPAPPAPPVIPELPEITLVNPLGVATASNVANVITANTTTSTTTIGNLIQNTNNTSTTTTGSSPGGPTGCPAPWINITLADGSTIQAGDIEVGMMVYTKHENKDEWGEYKIIAKELFNDKRWLVKFTDGTQFVGTYNHRVLTDNSWSEIRNLKSGNKVLGKDGVFIVENSQYYDEGDVVKITVEDAHTYLTEGFISHNIKISPIENFPPD